MDSPCLQLLQAIRCSNAKGSQILAPLFFSVHSCIGIGYCEQSTHSGML